MDKKTVVLKGVANQDLGEEVLVGTTLVVSGVDFGEIKLVGMFPKPPRPLVGEEVAGSVGGDGVGNFVRSILHYFI